MTSSSLTGGLDLQQHRVGGAISPPMILHNAIETASAMLHLLTSIDFLLIINLSIME